MGAVPAGTAAFACWGGNGPQRTHSSLPPPPTPATAPHHKSPLVTFPAGSQPASSKNASITNKNLPLRSPVPLSLSLIHTYTHTHTHTHTHMRTHSDPCHSFTVCWLGRRPEVTSCLGNSGGPGQVLLLAIPSTPAPHLWSFPSLAHQGVLSSGLAPSFLSKVYCCVFPLKAAAPFQAPELLAATKPQALPPPPHSALTCFNTRVPTQAGSALGSSTLIWNSLHLPPQDALHILAHSR